MNCIFKLKNNYIFTYCDKKEFEKFFKKIWKAIINKENNIFEFSLQNETSFTFITCENTILNNSDKCIKIIASGKKLRENIINNIISSIYDILQVFFIDVVLEHHIFKNEEKELIMFFDIIDNKRFSNDFIEENSWKTGKPLVF